MKKKFYISVLLLGTFIAGVALFWQVDRVDYNQIGLRYIPEEKFNLTDIAKDTQVRLVYLDFWASWCIPCRDSFPWMQRMVERYHQQGLRVVTINLDQQETMMQAFIETYGANFPVVHNPSFSFFRNYPLTGLPSSILFDSSNGKPIIHTIHHGFNKIQAEEMEAEIVTLLQKGDL